MRVPGQPKTRTFHWDDDLLPFLSTFGGNAILQLLQIGTQIHNPHFSALTMVVPKGNYGGISQGSYSVDIESSLDLLDDDIGVFVVFVDFIVVVEFCLGEVGPFHKVNAVFIGVVAAALNSEDFVGVFVHFLEMGERSIEGGGSRHEIYGHGRPLDVESVQHVISFIVEF
jgi:hypothetical protein